MERMKFTQELADTICERIANVKLHMLVLSKPDGLTGPPADFSRGSRCAPHYSEPEPAGPFPPPLDTMS